MILPIERRTINLLREAGIGLSLDWDDALNVEIPADIRARLLAVVKTHRDEFVAGLQQMRRVDLQVFVGGSLNGQKAGFRMSAWRKFCLHHLDRGRWEVYVQGSDGRGFYVGERSSNSKARALAIGKLKERTT